MLGKLIEEILFEKLKIHFINMKLRCGKCVMRLSMNGEKIEEEALMKCDEGDLDIKLYFINKVIKM